MLLLHRIEIFWKDYNRGKSGGYLPDLSQKADSSWTSPIGTWSYGGPVAVANALWFFHLGDPTDEVVSSGTTPSDLIEDLAERMQTDTAAALGTRVRYLYEGASEYFKDLL